MNLLIATFVIITFVIAVMCALLVVLTIPPSNGLHLHLHLHKHEHKTLTLRNEAAQLTPPDEWPEIRAHRRALAERNPREVQHG